MVASLCTTYYPELHDGYGVVSVADLGIRKTVVPNLVTREYGLLRGALEFK